MLKTLINSLPLSFRDKYRARWHGLKQEWLILFGKNIRLLHRPKRPQNSDGSVNLHLGCGNIDHPSFINIDIIPARHVHYVRRIDDLSPFRDNTVDLVYACHCLEHFSHRRLVDVLKEWHRVLKKGGSLRVSVPDFDSMVDLYMASGRDIEYVVEPITGGQDTKYNFHMTIFNKRYLEKQFREAGFEKVQEWTPGSSELTSFNDWSAKSITYKGQAYPISLNLEAIK